MTDPANITFRPIKLVHVVSTSSLSQTLFLPSLPKRFPCMSYNPDVFAPVIHKRLHPKATCLIFASGTVVITGVASPWAARMVLQKLCLMLQQEYKNIHLLSFRIVNIVLKTKFSTPIDLGLVKQLFPLESYYEEEVFPGLVFRDFNTKVVLTIYRTGSVILPGHKNRATIINAHAVLQRICNMLNPDASASPPPHPQSCGPPTSPQPDDSLADLARRLRQDAQLDLI